MVAGFTTKKNHEDSSLKASSSSGFFYDKGFVCKYFKQAPFQDRLILSCYIYQTESLLTHHHHASPLELIDGL